MLRHTKHHIAGAVENDVAHVERRHGAQQVVRAQVPHLRRTDHLQAVAMESAVDDGIYFVKFVNLKVVIEEKLKQEHKRKT